MRAFEAGAGELLVSLEAADEASAIVARIDDGELRAIGGAIGPPGVVDRTGDEAELVAVGLNRIGADLVVRSIRRQGDAWRGLGADLPVVDRPDALHLVTSSLERRHVLAVSRQAASGGFVGRLYRSGADWSAVWAEGLARADGAALAVGPDGVPHVVWLGLDGCLRAARILSDGVADLPGPIDCGNALSRLAVEVDGEGVVHVAFAESSDVAGLAVSDVFVVRLRGDRAAWNVVAGPISPRSPPAATDPALAVRKDGTEFLAYVEPRVDGPLGIRVARRRPDAQNFEYLGQPPGTEAERVLGVPWIDVDGRGQAVVAWLVGEDGAQPQLRVVRWEP